MPSKEDYWKHREKYAKKSKEYYLKNRESILEKQKQYQKSNAEKIRCYGREFRYSTRKERLEKGLCARCGEYPHMPYFTRCIKCWDMHKYHSKLYHERHRKRILERNKNRREIYKKEGRCTCCGIKIEAKTVCVNCMMRIMNQIESKWGKYATINRKLTEQSQHLRIRR